MYISHIGEKKKSIIEKGYNLFLGIYYVKIELFPFANNKKIFKFKFGFGMNLFFT